ncbi:hypothetical protein [Pendulispora albinea]|uniref:Lipoprotein n=1 Tax=Pendulispora albinea TaxID=2741071 RepID=A0ABZ2LSP4_9BACT
MTNTFRWRWLAGTSLLVVPALASCGASGESGESTEGDDIAMELAGELRDAQAPSIESNASACTQCNPGYSCMNGVCANAHGVDVPLEGQRESEWCWAASSRMVKRTFLGPDAGVPLMQCDLANAHFGRNDCCKVPVPGACNRPSTVDLDIYGIDSEWMPYLTARNIQYELETAHRPFIIAWDWHGGGSHIMVGKAFHYDVQFWITLNNPLPVGAGDVKTISYDEYMGGVEFDHEHQSDRYVHGERQ